MLPVELITASIKRRDLSPFAFLVLHFAGSLVVLLHLGAGLLVIREERTHVRLVGFASLSDGGARRWAGLSFAAPPMPLLEGRWRESALRTART